MENAGKRTREVAQVIDLTGRKSFSDFRYSAYQKNSYPGAVQIVLDEEDEQCPFRLNGDRDSVDEDRGVASITTSRYHRGDSSTSSCCRSGDVIDVDNDSTGSDGDVAACVPTIVMPPRLRSLTAWRPPAAADDEVVEVQPHPRELRCDKSNVEEPTEGDVALIGSSGGLLAADLPHARSKCPVKPFIAKGAKRTVAANAMACANCWCYVCEQPAAKCPQWTSTDTKLPAHCNGHERNKLWVALRRTFCVLDANV
mmetsp:Transcript_10680/g.17915  ORF Transcript_10680/g.17915 Transcript_10680/m.17915 type:complete len:255 (+) Transcript_10680:50-814(+)|eukprot:CAMPEP_0119337634 /NCGR_PEP_ID=MMETSP1333-20130426/94401_1 /TAXON_ID=418940 /ORGANISM="Scyphosphaera apsteinii, Strain RCC1455" /LENGTH=254 /DNA_ID=CAMNT_0007348723 /DNA_START=46 /DNA_END=810 /DNA_ORIENTATION=-